MNLTAKPQSIEKPGSVVRVRVAATNNSDEPRVVTLRFGATDVRWRIAPHCLRQLGPLGGYVLPQSLSLSAFADGPDVDLEFV